MIYAILALLLVIAIIVIVILFKKNKSWKFKYDRIELERDSILVNITNYKKLIVKLNNRKVESETVKNNISNATGSDLAILANSL